MRDMANSCATINVAARYIFCSNRKRAGCQTGRPRKNARCAARHRPPDHGAARSAGPALVSCDCLGAARRAADLARAARGLRRRLADGAAGAAGRIARGGLCRAGPRAAITSRRWARIDRYLPAAASVAERWSKRARPAHEESKPPPPSGSRRRPARSLRGCRPACPVRRRARPCRRSAPCRRRRRSASPA